MKSQIIVFGNEKGGSGKTTVSIHVAIYMASKGYSVGAIDLDVRQKSFGRYIENRTSYADNHKISLPIPKTVIYPESEVNNQQYIADLINKMADNHDLIIIDTPGSTSIASCMAHSMADIIITPINDSFVDLDLLGQVKNNDYNQIIPGIYSETIWNQKLKKAKETNSTIDWIVIRNRLSNLEAKNKHNVERILSLLSKKFGFRICSAFSERVIFRELFTKGLTLVDIINVKKEKPILSHVAARQELRNLVDDLGLLNNIPQAIINF